MNLTFKALGALLTYPDAVLLQGVGEIFQVLDEDTSIPSNLRPRLRSLQDYLRSTDPWELQESYVERFDTGRATSLHLFEHVHGESRDRGQAMVDLKSHYEALGLNLVPNELPDFLPAFLEYLSLLEPSEAGKLLGDCLPILEVLDLRLKEKSSPYGAVFPVLMAFADPSGSGSQEKLPQIIDEKTMDEEWAEEPAFSTLKTGAC